MSSVSTPMVGTWTVEVKAVKPFTIHGDLYYELHVTRDEQPGQVLGLRIPQHVAAVREPQLGDRLVLTFLMGQVTKAEAVQ
jgi:hypothetical protein